MPVGLGYQENGQPIPGMPKRGSGVMDALNFLLNGVGRSQSTGQSFFSPQFELMSAFNERGLDQEFGRPQKQPGALGNVPGFFSDIARKFSPTTPFQGQSGTGANPMESFSRAFNRPKGGRTAFGGSDSDFRSALNDFKLRPGEAN